MIILSLLVLTVLLGIGFAITGAILSACIWAFIKLPLGLICVFLGIALCCTILLIPLGLGMMKLGGSLMLPGGII